MIVINWHGYGDMIVITGVSGFIGKCLLSYFNKQNINNCIIIDNYYNKCLEQYKYSIFLSSFKNLIMLDRIQAIVHLGAISDTLEKDTEKLKEYNTNYTNSLFDLAYSNNIPFIFASTAAIYGNNGTPLNAYAQSKLDSEKYIDNKAVILRLFNVYGYGENHKGRMASTIYHWYNQLLQDGIIKLFYHSDQYLRDFIYIKDVCSIIEYCISNYCPGTYDIGTGISSSFEQIANIMIQTMGYGKKTYIDMPLDLVNQYQTYTLADINNLRQIGYNKTLSDIGTGIRLYIADLNLDTKTLLSTI